MKTKMISLAMVILMLLSLAACSGSDSGTTKNPSATPKPSDTTDTQTGDDTDKPKGEDIRLFYEEIDISQFDPSKFDGILKLSEETEVQPPIDAEKLLASGFTLMQGDVDLLANGPDVMIEEVRDKEKNTYVKSPVIEVKRLPVFQNHPSAGATFREILDGGNFSLQLDKSFGNFKIVPSGSDKKTAPVEDVINTLGQPSKLIYFRINYETGDVASATSRFSLCYEYDDFAIVFLFSEMIVTKVDSQDFDVLLVEYYGKAAWEEYLAEEREAPSQVVVE